MVSGGKGANQAVCAARLGAEVTFVGCVGSDVFGEKALENLRQEGLHTESVRKDESLPSGIALIVVDDKGENAIVVAPGANSGVCPSDIDHAREAIADADAVLLQFEIPLETVSHAIETAKSLGVRTILNPAPMRPVPDDLLSKVDVLILNQHEAAQLLGRGEGGDDLDAKSAAHELAALEVPVVVITLGSQGAYVFADGRGADIEPIKVNAVDTTAAGDAFTGAFACALAEDKDPFEAAKYAGLVAAISVTRPGAQTSLPDRGEVKRLGSTLSISSD
jgi:ribokinase